VSRFRDFDVDIWSWQTDDSQMRLGSIPFVNDLDFEQLRIDNSARIDKWWVSEFPSAILREIREYGIWIFDNPAGVVTLWNIDPETKTAYLSYWIDEKWEGFGYVTRGIKALIEHLSEERELSTIYAIIQPSNVASLRVAEKSGMNVSGFETYPMVDGTMAEHLIYKKDL
jgi:RimJ/RimL family protein N-acetyltransferase